MENRFIRADDVAQELNVSKPYAYKLIRKLNEELKAKGFITIGAVSYTHLDVYKRQAQPSPSAVQGFSRRRD